MAIVVNKAERKDKQIVRVTKLLLEFEKVLIVDLNNVGATQCARIRRSIREMAEMICMKKCRVRVAINKILEQKPHYAELIPLLNGNIGLVFSNGDLSEIARRIDLVVVPAAAKVGMVANRDVVIPPGPTGLAPTEKGFLQNLNIASKVMKGQLSTINPVTILAVGQKVTPSEAVLLDKLNICPFELKMECVNVFDSGMVYPASVLKISHEEVLNQFRQAVLDVAAASLAMGVPNAASIPHMIQNSLKDMFAIGLAVGYIFDELKPIKERLDNPDAFAAAAPAAAAEEAAAEEAEEDESGSESSSASEAEFDLFG